MTSDFIPPEIHSSTSEFVKAVGKRYGSSKQFSDEAKKSGGDGLGETGVAAATGVHFTHTAALLQCTLQPKYLEGN